ncbi:MAG TPA: GerMN domain-containing protein [Dissulfurispiraceae bacterium]|nr:GerMN domain-containing protein [Dissulfurispiraceae bacterium]
MGNKKYIVIALFFLLASAVAGWFVTQHFQSAARLFEQPLPEAKKGGSFANTASSAAPGDDTVAVKVFLPSDEGTTVVEKRIRNNPVPVKMAEAVAAEYLKGLKDGLSNAKLLGVYRDKRNIIYIDVSDEFRKNFSGDIRQEFELLKALYETIMVNIPGTEDVRLLVDGKEVESIGGHFNALYPLGDILREDLRQPAANSTQPG